MRTLAHTGNHIPILTYSFLSFVPTSMQRRYILIVYPIIVVLRFPLPCNKDNLILSLWCSLLVLTALPGSLPQSYGRYSMISIIEHSICEHLIHRAVSINSMKHSLAYNLYQRISLGLCWVLCGLTWMFKLDALSCSIKLS
jgi:hypothetical protein